MKLSLFIIVLLFSACGQKNDKKPEDDKSLLELGSTLGEIKALSDDQREVLGEICNAYSAKGIRPASLNTHDYTVTYTDCNGDGKRYKYRGQMCFLSPI